MRSYFLLKTWRNVFLAGVLFGFSFCFAEPTLEIVTTPNSLTSKPAGTIVIQEQERALYLIMDGGLSRRYHVAVPKSGKKWYGPAAVEGKFWQPDWVPPFAVKKDHPNLPNFIPGGDPKNPMGLAAITLDRSEIAIHGTAEHMRSSIGRAASYGCIRMLNEDIADLYRWVDVGSPVEMRP